MTLPRLSAFRRPALLACAILLCSAGAGLAADPQASSEAAPPLSEAAPTSSEAAPPLPESNPQLNPSAPAKETPDAAEAEKPKPPSLPGERDSVPWSEAEIREAKQQCDALLAKIRIDYEPLEPIREGVCGAPAPILVKSIGESPKVEIDPPATLRCPLAAELDKWLSEVVQPEAERLMGSPVTALRNAASYTCRNRYGKREGKISEHAKANALDISEFTFAGGETLALAGNWPDGGSLTALNVAPPMPLPNPVRLAAAEKAADAKAQPEATLLRRASEQMLEVVKTKGKAQAAERPAEELAASANPHGEFMVKVHGGACKFFGTVLGPEANAAHKSHFHLDGIERRKNFCE